MIGGLAGAGAGIVVVALVGSLFGPPGAIIGPIIGGIIGAGGSAFKHSARRPRLRSDRGLSRPRMVETARECELGSRVMAQPERPSCLLHHSALPARLSFQFALAAWKLPNSKTNANLRSELPDYYELAASNWFQSRQRIRSSHSSSVQAASVPVATWRDFGALLLLIAFERNGSGSLFNESIAYEDSAASRECSETSSARSCGPTMS